MTGQWPAPAVPGAGPSPLALGLGALAVWILLRRLLRRR